MTFIKEITNITQRRICKLGTERLFRNPDAAMPIIRGVFQTVRALRLALRAQPRTEMILTARAKVFSN